MLRRLLILPLAFTIACASTGDAGAARDKTRTRYSAEAGESPVGAIPDVVIRDESRGRDVALTIEYPTKAGSYPLIVFSHGFGGSNRGYVGLSSYWASQGYVVIKPTHADSGRLRDAGDVDDIWESQTAADWRNRVRDVTFVIDSLDVLEQRYPELKGKIDRSHIGVGGHSYGAFTAMLAGGARTFPGSVSYADPRVKAIVAMSPQGTAANRGLTQESFASIGVPALFMTGSRDRGTNERETPEWRREAYTYAPAGDKWFVSVEGAGHFSFSGRRGEVIERRQETTMPGDDNPMYPAPSQRTQTRMPPQAGVRERAIFRTIQATSLAFWDLYLRGDAGGRTELERLATGGSAAVEQK
jgi:predicted dienelactone hydrolase